ncbi:MAG: translation initiation factor IF-2, partial [Clostridia bacterium]|nr:translation initiation factor IF-2 [Clostridia bacterium]
MISNAKYKVASIAKDLGLKSNDLVNILKAHSDGAAVHTSTIDEDDFAVIFEVLTSENQISGLEDYLAGRVDVAVEHRPAPKEKKPEKPKPETNEPKAPEKQEQKKEPAKKPEEKKPEPKQEQKPEPKTRAEQFRQQQQKLQQKQQQKEKPREKRPNEKERQSKIITQSGGGHGDAAQVKTKTRIIDTRSANVELGKYDEHLDSFVSERDSSNYSKDRQKIKKKNEKGQEKGTKIKTEREKEIERKEKKKREVFENAKHAQLHVQIPDYITVGELASRLKVTAAEVVKRLMMMGSMLTVNDTVDYDTAYLIGDDLGAVVTKEVVVTIEEKLFDETEDKPDQLKERAPVVCVMGHVDHGKTSLLDAIRHTNVTKGEAGGITQHIGAYRVKINGRDITFLDTPGHEAFTAMRLRGAMATDIAVIVVAADDGIMPQTVEAINHAKAANVSIIIAINKMDKPHANPDQVKQELMKYDLMPEEWGEDTICVPVSALTGMGIDDLLENILLVADVKELKANPDRSAKGIVIESRLDKGRGPVATVLVQNGTLKSGDTVIAGTAVGRIRQ